MKCVFCDRPGTLVCQSVQPAPANDPTLGPWVFRYYMCRWHTGAWNRKRLDCQRRMVPLEFVPDAVLLPAKRPTPDADRQKGDS
jgi:hypothetical protein